MGGGGDGTEKNFGPISSDHESDASKDLDMMRCSNKVPKSVTHDFTRGRTDSSYYSM